MAAAGDDGEYLRHDQGVVAIPAAFPYAFALEEQPEGDQVEAAAAAEELGGGGPGALDMMQLDEIAYWLLDLHVLDPLIDDPHGDDDDDSTASVSTITAEISIAGDHERMLLPAEIADWDDQWRLQVHHDLAADPHGDDDSTATSTSAAESWADGGGYWEMQIDKGDDDDEGEWVLRGHGAADDAATASTAESWVGGDDHRLQPYACDCAAAAGDLSVECWWVPEPEPTGPPPDQLALDGDVFLQDLVLGDMQQLLV